MKQAQLGEMTRDEFIDFISSQTPEQLNELIRTQGKPPKLIDPMYFYQLPQVE